MAGKCRMALIVLVAALAVTTSASASSPDVAAMNLQLVDVPGAKVTTQRLVTEKGYVAAHLRVFTFAAPSGSARLYQVESETKLASSAAVPTAEIATTEKFFRSTAGRKNFIAGVAKGLKVKPRAVMMGKVRTVPGYDQGIEVPVSISVKGLRIYEDIVYLRLDRVVVFMVEGGLRPIGAAVTAKYTAAIAGHIGTELAPITVSPPTVTGTAQQGQTLTATPGTWTAPDVTVGYQWQRCDAAGANCVDVPGTTTSTYAVTAADAGSTLHVVVTATNRFGSAPATSAQTAVVT